MEIFIKLLLAHFVTDFLLQWPKMLSSKEQQKFASPYLYLHGLLHGAISFLLVMDLAWLPAIAIIAVTHTIIDGLKLVLTTKANERLLFFIDQILHIVIITTLCLYYGDSALFESLPTENLWVHALMVFFVTCPTSIFIQKIFLKWELPNLAKDSLPGVGVYIGFLERILIYVAVVSHQWSLVGFLIAAKSIFRFGDFSKSEDRKYAEYLFVGTLLSLFFAVLAGLLFLMLTAAGAVSLGEG